MVAVGTAQRRIIRLFVRGNRHLKDAVLSRSDGGSKLEVGAREILREWNGGGVDLQIDTEPCQGVSSFRRALEAGGDGGTSATGAGRFQPDIVLLSLEPDLLAEPPPDAEQFEQDLHEVVRLIKGDLGSHVLVMTASTVDPDEVVSSYHGLEQEPASLRSHRLDLATMNLSFQEGISLIDADRLLAEMGAGEHVHGFLDYSPAACESLCRELIRVIEDYGFLDDRPLIPQVGREQTGR